MKALALAGALLVVGCGSSSGDVSTPAAPSIQFIPASGLVDVSSQVVVSGITEEASWTIGLAATDADGTSWRASAAVGGVAEPLSLLAPDVTDPAIAFFALRGSSPVTVTARLLGQDAAVQEASVARRVYDEAVVSHRTIDAPGLVGTLFAGVPERPSTTVLVLGGSEGGEDDNRAALLASHGMTALALTYFGAPGLPTDLQLVPLEYFDSAFAWLASQPEVAPGRVCISGISKGAELALLLASRNPGRYACVIGMSPSAIVWQGVPSASQYAPVSSWTDGGAELPYVALTLNDTEIADFMNGTRLALAPAYARAFGAVPSDSTSFIPVDRITSPVLLLCGDDDQLWPSGPMSDAIVARLPSSSSHIYRHYAGAGHVFGLPQFPTAPSAAPTFLLGGSRAANVAATAAAWQEVLAFLGAVR